MGWSKWPWCSLHTQFEIPLGSIMGRFKQQEHRWPSHLILRCDSVSCRAEEGITVGKGEGERGWKGRVSRWWKRIKRAPRGEKLSWREQQEDSCEWMDNCIIVSECEVDWREECGLVPIAPLRDQGWEDFLLLSTTTSEHPGKGHHNATALHGHIRTNFACSGDGGLLESRGHSQRPSWAIFLCGLLRERHLGS